MPWNKMIMYCQLCMHRRLSTTSFVCMDKCYSLLFMFLLCVQFFQSTCVYVDQSINIVHEKILHFFPKICRIYNLVTWFNGFVQNRLTWLFSIVFEIRWGPWKFGLWNTWVWIRSFIEKSTVPTIFLNGIEWN